MSITKHALHNLAKAELHCHLGGAFDPAMLRTAVERGYRIPITPEELEAAYPVVSYEDFVRWHTIARAVRADFELMKLFFALHIERLKAQNVVYAEIMIGTQGFEGRTEEFVERGRALRHLADSVDGIEIGLVNSLNTSGSPEYAEELAEPLLRLHQAGVLSGVDWIGADLGYPLLPFRRTLNRLSEAGVGITVHAGEWAGPESVREAMEHAHPSRIGHGVAIFKDPSLVSLFREQQIHLELCPTSNVRSGVFERTEDHPLRMALDLGLNFSINSDDPGAFQCTIESEYRLAAEVFGFQEADLMHATENALRSRFPRASR